MNEVTISGAIGATVDRLGAIKAEIARLKADEDKLKKQLIEANVVFAEGESFRVAISHVDPMPVIDWRAIAERLNPTRQLVVAHTSYTEESDRVRVSARKA